MALERHRHEKRLFTSETRLRLALEAAQMGEWELAAGNSNSAPQMLFAAQADVMFGYPEHAFYGNRDQFMDLVHADDQGRVCSSIDASIQLNQSIDVEFRSHSSDKTFRWLRLQERR